MKSSRSALAWLAVVNFVLVATPVPARAQTPPAASPAAAPEAAPAAATAPDATTGGAKPKDQHAADPAAVMEKGSDFLHQHSWMALSCPSGEAQYDPKRRPVRLKEACQLSIAWVATHQEGTISFVPKEFRIRSVGSTDNAFIFALNQSYTKQTFTEDWYTPQRFEYGKTYAADIVYDVYVQGTQAPITQESVRVYQFKPVKNRITFQVTPKVFTAWEISDDGDRSYLVPAIAIGGAVRTADDYNNLDVFAIRLVAGAGPNLIANTQLERAMDGTITGVKNNQKIQVVAGFEVVLWRYLSAGLAWVPFGRDKSGSPLVLLSYGELYPAVVSSP